MDIVKTACGVLLPCGNTCQHSPINGEYCKKHANSRKLQYELAIKAGKKLCKGYTRGCNNTYEPGFVWCLDCRLKRRAQEKVLRDDKQASNNNPDKLINGQTYRFCIYCPGGGEYQLASGFITLKNTSSDKCANCLEKQRTVEQNRTRNQLTKISDQLDVICGQSHPQISPSITSKHELTLLPINTNDIDTTEFPKKILIINKKEIIDNMPKTANTTDNTPKIQEYGKKINPISKSVGRPKIYNTPEEIREKERLKKQKQRQVKKSIQN